MEYEAFYRGVERAAEPAHSRFRSGGFTPIVLDTPVVETTGFLRTGLAWIQAIRLNPEASHF